MEKIRKNFCGLLDGELSNIIDSSEDKDRIRATYLMLTADINEELLKSKKDNPEAEDRVLILGRSEVDAIKEYNNYTMEEYLEKRRSIDDPLDLPPFNYSEKVDSLWNMSIYTIDLPSFIGVAIGPGFYVFEEDFEVDVEISNTVRTSTKYKDKLLRGKQDDK